MFDICSQPNNYKKKITLLGLLAGLNANCPSAGLFQRVMYNSFGRINCNPLMGHFMTYRKKKKNEPVIAHGSTPCVPH